LCPSQKGGQIGVIPKCSPTLLLANLSEASTSYQLQEKPDEVIDFENIGVCASTENSRGQAL
jgi:hypothetical protein